MYAAKEKELEEQLQKLRIERDNKLSEFKAKRQDTEDNKKKIRGKSIE